MKQYPTQNELRKLIYCCAITGAVTLKQGMRRIDVSNNNGYKACNINGYAYPAHRIIWIYFNGDIAEGNVIDHVSGMRDDNSLDNLREVSVKQNGHNVGVMPNRMNKVNTKKVSTGWLATIDNNKLGIYSTQYDASSIAVYYKDQFRITYEGRDIDPSHIFHTDYSAFIEYINNLKTVDGVKGIDIIEAISDAI